MQYRRIPASRYLKRRKMVGLLHFELFLLLRVQDLALALEEKTFPQSAVNFLEDR